MGHGFVEIRLTRLLDPEGYSALSSQEASKPSGDASIRLGSLDNFENDDAADWMAGLAKTRSMSLLVKTLSYVVELGDEQYLELPEASSAIVAAEVVAEFKNAGSPRFPEELKRWVGKHRVADAALAKLALQAIQRIKTKSELQELWDATAYAADWHAEVANLQARLKRRGRQTPTAANRKPRRR